MEEELSVNLLPYETPARARRGSLLGVASVVIFVVWFSAALLFGPLINTLPVVLALLAEIVGFALGWAAIFKTRGRTVWGWLGVALNCLPVLLYFSLWLWVILGHRPLRL